MSQKHWSFTHIIRYIEEYERNPLLIERMKWEFILEGEYIVEFVKLCKHLVLERTIDPKKHQAAAICLRYSSQLLLKKRRAIRRLGVEKEYVSAILRQYGIHYREYGDNEHRVFFLDRGINLYFSKHDQSSIYIIQRIEFSNEKQAAFLSVMLIACRESPPIKGTRTLLERVFVVLKITLTRSKNAPNHQINKQNHNRKG